MQGLLAMLMALSVLLLVTMLFITHNSLDSAVVRGDSDQQRQWMAQQFSRIHSSQLRLEERLQAIDGRLDGLVSNGLPQASQPLLAQPASAAADTVAPERGLRQPSAAKEGRAKRHARGSASAAGCEGERRPYHVLLTAQDSLYHTTHGTEPALDSGLWRYGTVGLALPGVADADHVLPLPAPESGRPVRRGGGLHADAELGDGAAGR